MSVLVHYEIEALAREANLIRPFDPDSVEGASYDMKLGHQYVKGNRIESLTKESPTLVLAPGDFVVLRSLEVLRMPKNLIGHNGIMSPWAKLGLVSLFSPQIDPGFIGFLNVPVFNAGDTSISLNYGEKIFTVEFVRTNRPADYGWSEVHGRQETMTANGSPSFVRPNFSAINDSIGHLQRQLATLSSSEVALNTEIRVLRERLDQRDVSEGKALSKREIRVGVIAVILSVATLFVGNTVSDWIKSRYFTAPNSSPIPTAPAPPDQPKNPPTSK